MEQDSSCRSRFGFRGVALASIGLFAFSGVSCMTTYDAYGRPVQSVDPGIAVAGVAAAGLIGYALADDDDDCGTTYYPTRSSGYGSCGSGYGGHGGSYGGYGSSWGGGYGSHGSHGGYGGYGGYGGCR